MIQHANEIPVCSVMKYLNSKRWSLDLMNLSPTLEAATVSKLQKKYADVLENSVNNTVMSCLKDYSSVSAFSDMQILPTNSDARSTHSVSWIPLLMCLLNEYEPDERRLAIRHPLIQRIFGLIIGPEYPLALNSLKEAIHTSF